ncbi:MAG: NAD(P)H-dependent glycerol-3-phosphate dehydrogenase [Bacteroidales bacterium]|nr:NAD(P)H-dependent glycerol-3-phosphate dehydrogenase [Candidatus Equibacterium intestinale]
MRKKLQYGVVGNGSWATALVKILTETNSVVYWYVRKYEYIEYIEKYHRNPMHLQAVALDTDALILTDNINELVSMCDVVVFCVPSTYFLDQIKPIQSMEGKYAVSAIKGLVGEENYTISQYFNKVMGVPEDHIAVLSGPTHAEEVSMEHLSYLTVSSVDPRTAATISNAFSCRYVQTIQGTDVIGVEYATCMKNVYAIACGICNSFRLGDNFQAVLVTSAYNEMVEFLNAIEPDPNRIPSRSAYLGDLLVTCYSQFSRNIVFGSMIGRGYSVVSTQAQMNMVAEGYYGTKHMYEIACKAGIRVPIIEAVYKILYENVKIKDVLKKYASALA